MSKRHNRIKSHVAAVRERRGLSASDLADMIGVSRQAIYAIEAGSYVPNTALGLKLARALSVGIEDLFALPEDPPASGPRSVSATLVPAAEKLRAGQPVRLCRVDGKLIAAAPTPVGSYLPASDAVVASTPASPHRVQVRPHELRLHETRLHQQKNAFEDRLLIAGCDPAMAVLAHYLRPAGVDLIVVHQNSSQSLALLKNGSAHIAGTHLRDAATGESNISAVTRLFAPKSVAVISFAAWQEGLITAGNNPKKVRRIEDLARRDVAFVNRELGSGSRLLLDTQLAQLGLGAKRIRGYDRLASGHLAAAWQVKTGAADCCVATEAAARVFGLNFVPLGSARYDLVIRKPHLKLPAVETLLNTVALAAFRRELSSAGGYDTSIAGDRVF